MQWCTFVAGGMVHSVMRETLGELKRVPELMGDSDEYVVRSSVSSAHFMQFLGYTIGDKIEITVENFNDMKSLASEFGFARLQAKVDDFRTFRDDSPDYEGLQKRYEKLDQRLRERDTEVTSLKVTMQMWLNAMRDRVGDFEEKRRGMESEVESLKVMMQMLVDMMRDKFGDYEEKRRGMESELESLKDAIKKATATWTGKRMEELPEALDKIQEIVAALKAAEDKMAQLGSLLDQCFKNNEDVNRRVAAAEQRNQSLEEKSSMDDSLLEQKLTEATSAWEDACARFEPLIQANEKLNVRTAGAQCRIRALEEDNSRMAQSVALVGRRLTDITSEWEVWRAHFEPLIQTAILDQSSIPSRTKALNNAIANIEARMSQLSEALKTTGEQAAEVVEATCAEHEKKLDAPSEPVSETDPEQASQPIPAPPPGGCLVWVARRWPQAISVTGSKPSSKKRGPNNVLDSALKPNEERYYQSSGKSVGDWLEFDLQTVLHRFDNYTLEAYQLTTCRAAAGKNHLKSWELRVSADRQEWTTVDRRIRETCLNNANATAIFHPTANTTEPFRYIRLVLTGPNHGGTFYLVLAHIDFCLLIQGAAV